MILSSGERAVWAAAYLKEREQIGRDHDPRSWRQPPTGKAMEDALRIADEDAVCGGIIAAHFAVEELRDGLGLLVARPNPGAGALDAIQMLRAMLGESPKE